MQTQNQYSSRIYAKGDEGYEEVITIATCVQVCLDEEVPILFADKIYRIGYENDVHPSTALHGYMQCSTKEEMLNDLDQLHVKSKDSFDKYLSDNDYS